MLKRTSALSFLIVPFVCGFLAGCGGSPPDGPQRYQLSGKVSFDGKAVPAGTVYFSPDQKQGNQGPGTIAMIKNGTYRTLNGKGVVGGPMLVEVNGSDGVAVQRDGMMDESGTPLFSPYKFNVDLPKENSTHDIVVPKRAN